MNYRIALMAACALISACGGGGDGQVPVPEENPLPMPSGMPSPEPAEAVPTPTPMPVSPPPSGMPSPSPSSQPDPDPNEDGVPMPTPMPIMLRKDVTPEDCRPNPDLLVVGTRVQYRQRSESFQPPSSSVWETESFFVGPTLFEGEMVEETRFSTRTVESPFGNEVEGSEMNPGSVFMRYEREGGFSELVFIEDNFDDGTKVISKFVPARILRVNSVDELVCQEYTLEARFIFPDGSVEPSPAQAIETCDVFVGKANVVVKDIEYEACVVEGRSSDGVTHSRSFIDPARGVNLRFEFIDGEKLTSYVDFVDYVINGQPSD